MILLCEGGTHPGKAKDEFACAGFLDFFKHGSGWAVTGNAPRN
jgi:hypothetical protein